MSVEFQYFVSFSVERRRPFLWFEQTWFTTERQYVTDAANEDDAIKNAKARLPGNNIRNVVLLGVVKEAVPQKNLDDDDDSEETERRGYRIFVKTVIGSHIGPETKTVSESFYVKAFDAKEAEKRALLENDFFIDKRMEKMTKHGIMQSPFVVSTTATIY